MRICDRCEKKVEKQDPILSVEIRAAGQLTRVYDMPTDLCTSCLQQIERNIRTMMSEKLPKEAKK